MTPDNYTISEQMLDVRDGHTLYIHEWGTPNVGVSIIFLHGGPGGQSKDKHKGVFYPERQHVIFFDQRGGGKSLPYGSLEHNTTAEAVADVEKIADHFGLTKFILHGNSWGSALALFYAIQHPNRVHSMVLNGVWTGSKSENDWVDKGGFQAFYPEVWERYAASAPEEFRNDPSTFHFPRILGDDLQASKESSLAYASLEGAAVSLDDRFTPDQLEDFDPSGIRVEVHYLANQCFMPNNYVFDNASKLTMPIWLIQGRQDMVCPPITAYKLQQLLPNGELIWTTSGHRPERETWNVTRTVMLRLSEEN